jgi:CubicO group peptidase (beta-lactamase class C family)
VRGAAVALVRGGSVVWTGSFGVADQRSGDPVTSSTVFEAASLGKVVAAYAALSLVEEGTWSLGTPARSSRLEVEAGCKAPRLGQLLSHRAGLSNDLRAERFVPACRLPAPFRYAGQGWLVLQDMFEIQTAKSAELLIQERVFRPLGMTRSSYAQPAPDDLATGHVDAVWGVISGKADTGVVVAGIALTLLGIALCVWANRSTWRNRPAGRAVALIVLQWGTLALILVGIGFAVTVPVESWSRRTLLPSSLHSSADDLARFAQELVRPRLLRPETRDLLFAEQVDVGGGLAWGAGIGIDRSASPATFWQWGSNPGFQGLLVVEPERGDAIVVLTNTGGFLDYVNRRVGGYNMAKRVAREALGIRGRWDLRQR